MSTTEQAQRRRVQRSKASVPSVIRIELRDGMGNARNITADLVDWSDAGLKLALVAPLKPGAIIKVRGKLGDDRIEVWRRATVSWCNEDSDGGYRVGVEFLDVKSERSGEDSNQNSNEHSNGHSSQHSNQYSDFTQQTVASEFQAQDYYEIMQLSPNADTETIHRVYRLLAQRYHPDNGETGSSELFVELTEAFQALSDPEKRAAYDARHSSQKQLRWKIFDQTAVASGPEVEKRKRRGILALLYAATVKEPERASMTVHTFEQMLGCPREHLEASLWYLRGKGFVQRTDGGRYTLTVHGFEEAEEHCVKPKKTAGEISAPTQPD